MRTLKTLTVTVEVRIAKAKDDGDELNERDVGDKWVDGEIEMLWLMWIDDGAEEADWKWLSEEETIVSLVNRLMRCDCD